jgi:excisionase family DNA binding protein
MSRKRDNPSAGLPVLSVQDLAKRWAVDVKTIYQAIELGQIPVIRVGKRVIRIPRAFIERLEQGRVVPEREI